MSVALTPAPSPTQQLVQKSLSTSVEAECIGRTAGLDPVPIGDSAQTSPTRTDSDNRQTRSGTNPILRAGNQNSHPMITRAKVGITKPNPRYVLLTHKVEFPEPRTVAEALRHPGWNGAMSEEMVNCKEAGTWTLVPITLDMHVLGSRWVFRTKLNADGTLDKLKGRVVAKGCG